MSDLRDARGLSRTWWVDTEHSRHGSQKACVCEWRAKECSLFLVEEDMGTRDKAQGSVMPARVPEL